MILALVGWIDKFQIESMVVPFLFDGSSWRF
jgi:hypothetical protein